MSSLIEKKYYPVDVADLDAETMEKFCSICPHKECLKKGCDYYKFLLQDKYLPEKKASSDDVIFH